MKRRGQALIDSALALVVLMVAILGIVDGVQILYTRQALDERVRLAARMAAVGALDDKAIVEQVLTGVGFKDLRADQVRIRRLQGAVRVSIVGYRMPLMAAWGAGSIEAREIGHTEPMETRLPERKVAQ